MKINPDVVPSSLDHAIQILKEGIESEKDREYFKDTTGLHFGLGMCLRNGWSLWDRDTVLVQWFIKNLGIAHADDISSTILEAFSAALEGRQFDAKEHVQRYIEHWKNMGVDPIKLN